MLWTIAVILIVLWALGLVSSYTMGGFIHLLLIVALIVVVVGFLQGRRAGQVAAGHKPTCDRRRHEMKTYTLLGIILIVVGIVAFAYQGITYTTREKVVDLGPVHMTADRTRTLPLPPIVGAIALVGGIVLLVMGSKKG